jgi:dihydrolipoamide dehydrogenase
LSGTEVRVPDLGNFDEVAIVDVLVKVGESIEIDTPLVTLETDKATMDVPSTVAGKVSEVLVQKGGKLKAGDVVVKVEGAAATAKPAAAEPAAAAPAPASKPAPSVPAAAAATKSAPAAQPAPVAAHAPPKGRLVVLGAGPGGYTAAFRAADLGMEVTLIERWESLGGVCLNVGCIPSKALLHAAKVIDEAKSMAAHGVSFGEPKVDLDKLRGWKTSVVKRLTGGLTMLAKQRKVTVVHGTAKFASPNSLASRQRTATSRRSSSRSASSLPARSR